MFFVTKQLPNILSEIQHGADKLTDKETEQFILYNSIPIAHSLKIYNVIIDI